MKPTFLLTVALLFPLGFAILPHTPAYAQTQPNREQVLEACAGDQIRALPMPFVDVAPDHWAYDIVLKMYYCGPVRGPLAAQELQRLQNQSSQLPDANTLSSAQETVEIKGRLYHLESYLWHNAIPSRMKDGNPTNTFISVIADDKQAFPASLKLDRLWLIKDDGEMWTTVLNDEARQPAAYYIENTVNNGPTWEATLVSVVLRLTDGENNTYFLKAKEQYIMHGD